MVIQVNWEMSGFPWCSVEEAVCRFIEMEILGWDLPNKS
jgi:hypothetical protein